MTHTELHITLTNNDDYDTIETLIPDELTTLNQMFDLEDLDLLARHMTEGYLGIDDAESNFLRATFLDHTNLDPKTILTNYITKFGEYTDSGQIETPEDVATLILSLI